MTDTQLLHKANGIRRIRECCLMAKIELESNLVTVKYQGFVPLVTITEFGTILPQLPDFSNYRAYYKGVPIPNPPTQNS